MSEYCGALHCNSSKRALQLYLRDKAKRERRAAKLLEEATPPPAEDPLTRPRTRGRARNPPEKQRRDRSPPPPETLHFFSVPRDHDRAFQWISNSGRLDLLRRLEDTSQDGFKYCTVNIRFCAKHFEDAMFMNDKKNKLVWSAVPTIFKMAWDKGRGKIKKRSRPGKVEMVLAAQKQNEKENEYKNKTIIKPAILARPPRKFVEKTTFTESDIVETVEIGGEVTIGGSSSWEKLNTRICVGDSIIWLKNKPNDFEHVDVKYKPDLATLLPDHDYLPPSYNSLKFRLEDLMKSHNELLERSAKEKRVLQITHDMAMMKRDTELKNLQKRIEFLKNKDREMKKWKLSNDRNRVRVRKLEAQVTELSKRPEIPRDPPKAKKIRRAKREDAQVVVDLTKEIDELDGLIKTLHTTKLRKMRLKKARLPAEEAEAIAGPSGGASSAKKTKKMIKKRKGKKSPSKKVRKPRQKKDATGLTPQKPAKAKTVIKNVNQMNVRLPKEADALIKKYLRARQERENNKRKGKGQQQQHSGNVAYGYQQNPAAMSMLMDIRTPVELQSLTREDARRAEEEYMALPELRPTWTMTEVMSPSGLGVHMVNL